MRQSFAKSIVLLAATLSTNHVFATTKTPTDLAYSTFTVENGFIPVVPRVSGWLLGGRYVLGAGDFMVPLFGNSNSLLFTDLQGKDGNNASVASLGAGFRQVVGSEHILGAYVFFDHNNFANTNPFPSNSTFWIASPGVELLGQAWDFHANGYVPISSQAIDIMTAPAQSFGINNYVEFTQHEQLDRVLSLRNNVGPGW